MIWVDNPELFEIFNFVFILKVISGENLARLENFSNHGSHRDDFPKGDSSQSLRSA